MSVRRFAGMPVVVLCGLMSACATGPGAGSVPASTYQCGQLTLSVAETGDNGLLGLDYPGHRVLLKPVVSASGARYRAPGDDSTWFWSRGDRATLSLGGERYPECLVPGAIEQPFSGHGNEPFWQVRVTPGELHLRRPFEPESGADTFTIDSVTANHHGQTLVAGGGTVRLTIARQLCEDSMSGAQYPAQVRLQLDGEVLEGCGGDPERLLRGAEWQVTDLAGTGMLERSRVTLAFLSGGRLAGQASCNRFTGRYQLTGEGLAVDSLATTRMACAPALMHQEQRFLERLTAVRYARIDRQGRLRLEGPGGEAITAVQGAGQVTP